MAAVEHENIVAFIGYSLEPTLLIIMEFVEGGTLTDYLAVQDPLDPPGIMDLCRILIGSARAFEYLHSREPLPILHRDIKSENILLTEGLEPRVADLGEARVMAENATMTMGGFGFARGMCTIGVVSRLLTSTHLETQSERNSIPRRKSSKASITALQPTSSPSPSS